jgi:hypothetical protein
MFQFTNPFAFGPEVAFGQRDFLFEPSDNRGEKSILENRGKRKDFTIQAETIGVTPISPVELKNPSA